MLRLSKKSDYALMAMKHLALRGDRGANASSSAREIAELYDIPIELLAKVLQRLVRGGLLASQQGTRGGYQLARRPTLISVADVIQAIDGPVAVFPLDFETKDNPGGGEAPPPMTPACPATRAEETNGYQASDLHGLSRH